MSSKSRPRAGHSWYGVKTLYRCSALGRPKATDRSYDPWVTMVEERVVLFKTRSSTEAIRAPEKEARAYAKLDYVNPYGQRVVMRYLGACETFELFDPPGHAREVFSTTELVSKRVPDRLVIDRRMGIDEGPRPSLRRKKFLNQEFSGILSRGV